jgi:hypothetical protein
MEYRSIIKDKSSVMRISPAKIILSFSTIYTLTALEKLNIILGKYSTVRISENERIENYLSILIILANQTDSFPICHFN